MLTSACTCACLGTWSLRGGNFSTKFPLVFQKTSGNVVFELTSSKTDIRGVHYVQVYNFCLL